MAPSPCRTPRTPEPAPDPGRSPDESGKPRPCQPGRVSRARFSRSSPRPPATRRCCGRTSARIPAMVDPVTYSELVAGDVMKNLYEGFTDTRQGRQRRPGAGGPMGGPPRQQGLPLPPPQGSQVPQRPRVHGQGRQVDLRADPPAREQGRAHARLPEGPGGGEGDPGRQGHPALGRQGRRPVHARGAVHEARRAVPDLSVPVHGQRDRGAARRRLAHEGLGRNRPVQVRALEARAGGPARRPQGLLGRGRRPSTRSRC